MLHKINDVHGSNRKVNGHMAGDGGFITERGRQNGGFDLDQPFTGQADAELLWSYGKGYPWDVYA
jgi:hypothetical protein